MHKPPVAEDGLITREGLLEGPFPPLNGRLSFIERLEADAAVRGGTATARQRRTYQSAEAREGREEEERHARAMERFRRRAERLKAEDPELVEHLQDLPMGVAFLPRAQLRAMLRLPRRPQASAPQRHDGHSRASRPSSRTRRTRRTSRGSPGGDDDGGGDPPRPCVACGKPKCKGREKTCAACRKRAQRERDRLAALREEMQAPEFVVEAEPEPGAFEYPPAVWEWAMQTDGDGLPYTLPQHRQHREFGPAKDRELVVA